MQWTHAEDQYIIKTWPKGFTGAEIASGLKNGRSRNAVISRVYRLIDYGLLKDRTELESVLREKNGLPRRRWRLRGETYRRLKSKVTQLQVRNIEPNFEVVINPRVSRTMESMRDEVGKAKDVLTKQDRKSS